MEKKKAIEMEYSPSQGPQPGGYPAPDAKHVQSIPQGGGNETGEGSANLVDGICWERVKLTSFHESTLIGEGGFGKVFRVKHRRTGQEYAMKMMQKSDNRGLEMQYTLRERNILAYFESTQFVHPFIVRGLKAFETDTCLVLILEYCPGGNLRQLIKREHKETGMGLEEPLARLYTVEILMALEHLHMQAIIHRDLKPENVVLDAHRHALLTDLGLSKDGVFGARGAQSQVGDPRHWAPEVILNEGHGRTVDIYGLGVLLFEMLSGVPPFLAPESKALMKNIVKGDLKIPEGFSPEVGDFLRAVMHRCPESRLGATNTSDVRWHPYLAHMPFDAIYWRAVPVPEPRSPEAPRTSPEHVQHVKAAMAAAALEDWPSAEAHAQKGIDCAPNDRTVVMAYYELGRARYQQGRIKEAEEAVGTALAIFPKFEPLLQLQRIISSGPEKFPSVPGWSY